MNLSSGRGAALFLPLALIALGLGCGPQEPAPPAIGEDQSAMEMRRLPTAEPAPDRGFDAAVRRAGEERGSGCRAACAGLPQCIQTCLIDEQRFEARAARLGDCLYCGRETGFLGTPQLDLVLIEKSASLSWTAVEGADRYVVYGLRWDEERANPSAVESHAWRTEGLALSLELRAGTWSFYVIAYADEPKRRSRRSNVVVAEL